MLKVLSKYLKNINLCEFYTVFLDSLCIIPLYTRAKAIWLVLAASIAARTSLFERTAKCQR